MKKDIYFNPFYGKLYEESEKGTLETFSLDTSNGKIEHTFIKRDIQPIDGVVYCDLVTPYGYGGPLITQCHNKDRLLQEFQERFSAYCSENHVVSEFIRFHPIFQNALDFKDIYNVEYSRHTVGTNLKDYEDPVQAEFSKSLRRELKKAEQAGVTCEAIVNPSSLTTFKKLYEHTMDRNHASAYYYFPDHYYEYIIDKLGQHVLELQLAYEGSIIASELYFIEGDLMHAHLLGSDDQMLELKAGVMLEATAARWGKEHGYRYIHHGGGRSSAEDDALYLYKRKYGKNTTFDFYIGKKIWNQRIYDELCSGCAEIDFFPAYRSI